LVVTTADSSALLESYAAIKRSVADGIGPAVRLVVNQSDEESQAAEAHRRLANACRRFLGCELPGVPSLPRYVDTSGADSVPRVWERPNTRFGHAMLWLGRAVGDVLCELKRERDSCTGASGTLDDVQASHSSARC
jgi:MinD-like ATPase involved in chromosome partitioning or flagellar assembly